MKTLLRAAVIASLHFCLLPRPALAQLPAFPGAEGFGANAAGGRGGRVVVVTTTAASGPGSLQDALDQTGPRYVIFRVSGLIDARIHLSHGDVTIAGETSPGGITIRGFVTDETPIAPLAHTRLNRVLSPTRPSPTMPA